MLYNKLVPITESALLVIDAQDSFKFGDRWERRNNKEFERNVARGLISTAVMACP